MKIQRHTQGSQKQQTAGQIDCLKTILGRLQM